MRDESGLVSLRAAATFVEHNRERLPRDLVPRTATQLAIVAIMLAAVVVTLILFRPDWLELLSGFVVPPADVDALVSVLDWCVRHPSQLFEMRAGALAQAGRWTWRDFRAAFLH